MSSRQPIPAERPIDLLELNRELLAHAGPVQAIALRAAVVRFRNFTREEIEATARVFVRVAPLRALVFLHALDRACVAACAEELGLSEGVPVAAAVGHRIAPPIPEDQVTRDLAEPRNDVASAAERRDVLGSLAEIAADAVGLTEDERLELVARVKLGACDCGETRSHRVRFARTGREEFRCVACGRTRGVLREGRGGERGEGGRRG